MIDMVCSMASELGVKANPGKSDFLHLSSGRIDSSVNVVMGSDRIRTMAALDYTRFLGKPVGFSIVNHNDTIITSVC